MNHRKHTDVRLMVSFRIRPVFGEVYLQGQWYTFDARHNRRRIGRVLIGLGRDAADVPITMSFGQQSLEVFRVITEEIDLPVVPSLSLKQSNMRGQLEVAGARSYNNERLY
jgi:transglutaminase-like putative cysteine protease